jgi:hypothetical protein
MISVRHLRLHHNLHPRPHRTPGRFDVTQHARQFLRHHPDGRPPLRRITLATSPRGMKSPPSRLGRDAWVTSHSPRGKLIGPVSQNLKSLTLVISAYVPFSCLLIKIGCITSEHSQKQISWEHRAWRAGLRIEFYDFQRNHSQT